MPLVGALYLPPKGPPQSRNRINILVNVLVLLIIVSSAGLIVYGLLAPKTIDTFTEFYLLGSSGKAVSYPSHFNTSEMQSLLIGIGNYEQQQTMYTVEISLCTTGFNNATNTTVINEWTRIDRWTATLEHNTTQLHRFQFGVTDSKYNRIEFLLFKGDAPDDSVVREERIKASYRELYLPITVRRM